MDDWEYARELIDNLADDGLVNIILYDGYDKALIGVTAGVETRAVYSYEKMVKIAIENGCETDEIAREYIDFNIVGTYVGEERPVVVMSGDF